MKTVCSLNKVSSAPAQRRVRKITEDKEVDPTVKKCVTISYIQCLFTKATYCLYFNLKINTLSYVGGDANQYNLL